MTDHELDEIKRTISRAVSMGGELMRRGVMAIIELEIAKARQAGQTKIMDLLDAVVERIEKLKV